MNDRTLDSNVEEFRKAGHAAVDWIARYLQTVEDLPVLSSSPPGSLEKALAASPSESGRPYEELLSEFREAILPGITHWNHPAFFAYFSITGSQAGILGELLSAALNVNGMLWKTSPAATELETITLGWLRDLLGLPSALFGIINDTASINTFLALAAARESLGLSIRAEGMTGRSLPQLRIYCSDQTHSSIEKAALALGLGVRGVTKIASDAKFRMNADALAEAISRDRAEGVVPCAIVATVGTTSTASVDPTVRIGALAHLEKIWLHVDAAYGGSAAIVPELRYLWDGIENADSIVVNPHKWLFTPIDCSVLYTRRPDALRETFSLVPEYLRTTEGDEVINYMDYGIQLGRRFRALKLWMVIEHYGTEHLRQTIRGHIDLARRLADQIKGRDDLELVAPQSLSVVVFRRVVRDGSGNVDDRASDEATELLLETINRSGDVYVSHTKLRGLYAIRVAIGNGATEWRHVERILAHL